MNNQARDAAPAGRFLSSAQSSRSRRLASALMPWPLPFRAAIWRCPTWPRRAACRRPKYEQGLGVTQMAVAAPDGSGDLGGRCGPSGAARRPVAAHSEIRAVHRGDRDGGGSSKPIASYLHGLLGLPSACRVFETKHACFGGTAGLQNALDAGSPRAQRGDERR